MQSRESRLSLSRSPHIQCLCSVGCSRSQNNTATKRQNDKIQTTNGAWMTPTCEYFLMRGFEERSVFFAVPDLHPQSDKTTMTCNKPQGCTHPFPSTASVLQAEAHLEWGHTGTLLRGSV